MEPHGLLIVLEDCGSFLKPSRYLSLDAVYARLK